MGCRRALSRRVEGCVFTPKKLKNWAAKYGFGLMICVCVLVLAVSCAMLLSYWVEYSAARGVYNEMEAFVTVEEQPAGGKTTQARTVDFDALAAINPDVAAWLVSEGTMISYPVVQGADNAFYLKHLFDKTYNPSGTLFVDSAAAPDFAGRNTVIYGHNMNDGSMLETLLKYKKQSYFDAHPAMLLYTPHGDYTLELFAGFDANVQEDAWQLDFADDAAFESWLSRAKQRSNFASAVSPTAADRVVTLSTCEDYNNDDTRYVVMGRLVPAAYSI